jgi:hypothetical protein
VTCPVVAVPPEGVAEKVYPLIVAPPLVDGCTKEIPMEVAAREVTASVPGVDKMVVTSLVAGKLSAKPASFPTTERLYFVPTNKFVGDVMVIFVALAFAVPVMADPPETGVSEYEYDVGRLTVVVVCDGVKINVILFEVAV